MDQEEALSTNMKSTPLSERTDCLVYTNLISSHICFLKLPLASV
jgi:hypothetical protein